MNAFRFRLETLLRLRRAALGEQRAKLAEAYHADEILHQHIRRLEGQIEANVADRRSAAGAGAVNIDAALHAERFELILQSQRRELTRQRETIAAAIESQRQVVIEADRDVKVLERLRERRLTEHRAAEQLEEVKHLDEVAARVLSTGPRREEP